MIGEQLKIEGMSAAAANADKSHLNWSEQAELLVLLAAEEMQQFTTEDVRAKFGDLIPEPPDKRAWGYVMTKLAREGKITRVGFVKAKSKTVHGMYVSLWTGVVA
jgi:hypothetical protein